MLRGVRFSVPTVTKPENRSRLMISATHWTLTSKISISEISVSAILLCNGRRSPSKKRNTSLSGGIS